MSRIGYARVSTADQDNAIQVAALEKAGCNIIRQEKASGTSTAGHVELLTVLAFLQPGDVLVVTRVDRLARSVADLKTIVATLRERGASLEATEQPINTSTAAGKAFLDILAVFAEFETAIRRERQLEGILKAKGKGVYKGRKVTVDVAQVRHMRASGLGPTAIAKALNIGRASVYRCLE